MKVTTQSELDAALAAGETWIDIVSPAGVWLEVRASGSATVSASGSATVSASGSATVRAYGSATVRASGSATVRASGSATVRAYDSATVSASAYVAVHLHTASVTIEGGHIIDLTTLNLNDPETWATYHGAELLLADDGRGYKLGHRAGRYLAGCRDFDAVEAVAHWSDPEHDAPESAALLLAAVQSHVAALAVTA